MSAPHADRDHSEQPPSTATAGSDPTQPGTPRSVSARVVRASEAQVVAALDVLNCGAYQNRRGVVVCIHERHEHYGAWSERGCPVAAAVADAVVAAAPVADEVTLAEHGRSVREVAREVYGSEIERLKGALANARAKYADEVTRLRAEVERLQRVVEIAVAARKAAEEALTEQGQRGTRLLAAAREESRRLAEVVARIEMLAETMANEHGQSWNSITARRIRIHLSGPTPAETPQNGPEPALSREQGASGQSGEGEALGGAERCHADRDGDCSWSGCPQLRDGEPVATGRHCPLDTREEGR